MCFLLPDLVASRIASYLDAHMAMHLRLACRQWAGVVRRTLPHLRLALCDLFGDPVVLREDIEDDVMEVLARISALGEWLLLGCYWQKRHHHYHCYAPFVWHPGNTNLYKQRYPPCLSLVGLLCAEGCGSVRRRRERMREVYGA